MLKKIVIIGPESTGKSTLCKQLAEHYNSLCCPEFAREYLLQHGTNYTFENLLDIAKGQLDLEDKYVLKVMNDELYHNNSTFNTQHPTSKIQHYS